MKSYVIAKQQSITVQVLEDGRPADARRALLRGNWIFPDESCQHPHNAQIDEGKYISLNAHQNV
jgi:hypothetical protein